MTRQTERAAARAAKKAEKRQLDPSLIGKKRKVVIPAGQLPITVAGLRIVDPSNMKPLQVDKFDRTKAHVLHLEWLVWDPGNGGEKTKELVYTITEARS